MKIIKLIFINITKLIRESRSVFIFILTGIIASSFGILFYSGYFMYNHYDTYYACEVDITTDNNNSSEELKQLVKTIISENSFNTLVMSEKDSGFSDTDVLGVYYGKIENFLLTGSEYTSDETEPIAFLSEDIVEQLDYHRNITNEKIVYDGKTFTVSGIHRSFYSFCVPPLYYIENYDVNNIHVELDDIISDNLRNYLDSSDIEYRITNNESPFNSSEFIISLSLIIIIFSLSFVNILMMFSFWNIKMKQTFTVYYIYGCSRLKKFFIVSGQMFFISFTGTIIGSILYACVYKPLGKLKIVYSDDIKAYIPIFLIILAVLLAFSIYWGIKTSLTQKKTFILKEK